MYEYEAKELDREKLEYLRKNTFLGPIAMFKIARAKKQVDDFTKRTFFNKYRPIKKLGEGSFGKIYSAVNINNQQKFALKMVTK